jgi:hypothetical protein
MKINYDYYTISQEKSFNTQKENFELTDAELKIKCDINKLQKIKSKLENNMMCEIQKTHKVLRYNNSDIECLGLNYKIDGDYISVILTFI